MGSTINLKLNLILVELFLLLVFVFFVLMSSNTIVDKVFAGLLASVSVLNSLGICLENRYLIKRIYAVRLFMLVLFIGYFGFLIVTLIKKPKMSGTAALKELGDEIIKAGLVVIMFIFWVLMNGQLIGRLGSGSPPPQVAIPVQQEIPKDEVTDETKESTVPDPVLTPPVTN